MVGRLREADSGEETQEIIPFFVVGSPTMTRKARKMLNEVLGREVAVQGRPAPFAAYDPGEGEFFCLTHKTHLVPTDRTTAAGSGVYICPEEDCETTVYMRAA